MEAEPAFAYLSILLLSIPIDIIIGILAICLLLVCSALISGSEVAFFSMTPNDYAKLKEESAANNRFILDLKDKPRKLLATILISNNFINIAVVILSEYVLLRIFPPSLFEAWASGLMNAFRLNNYFSVEQVSMGIGISVTVVGVTFLLVLFGEVLPKVYAKVNNIRLAHLMARPLMVLMNIFSPFSNILVSWTKRIEKRLEDRAKNPIASRADIDEAIELTVRSDEEDSEQEVDILKSIVKFGDVAVKQIMTPRVDVVAIDIEISYEEVIKTVKESGYSRIPVYDENFDSVKGILYIKDLIGYLKEEHNFKWQSFVRPEVLYAPEAKKIDDLLREFQKKRMHMAVVVDEYGGSSGVVTLEDVMEEIIGEIKDEFDEEQEVDYEKVDDYNYIFEGKTLLNDVCRIIGIDTATFDTAKGEADSIAGLLLEILGSIPKVNTHVTHEPYRFKIISVNKRRIEKVLLTLPRE